MDSTFFYLVLMLSIVLFVITTVWLEGEKKIKPRYKRPRLLTRPGTYLMLVYSRHFKLSNQHRFMLASLAIVYLVVMGSIAYRGLGQAGGLHAKIEGNTTTYTNHQSTWTVTGTPTPTNSP